MTPERLESDADAVREAIESPRFRQFMELLAVGWRRRLIEQGEREARAS